LHNGDKDRSALGILTKLTASKFSSKQAEAPVGYAQEAIKMNVNAATNAAADTSCLIANGALVCVFAVTCFLANFQY
jgi:hypothetical protein